MSASRGDHRRTRTLVVQLADLGDLILAAPAIRWLAENPSDELTLLTKPSNRVLAEAIVDAVIYADKDLFDRPGSLLKPSALLTVVSLVRELRHLRFDRIILLNHLTTRFGAIKWAGLALLSGASIRVGLDNGRGWFLTDRKRDHGFGAATEESHWSYLVGGSADFQLPRDAVSAGRLLEQRGISGRYGVLHPGSGLYSAARRWPAARFANLARILHQELAIPLVLVGTQDERELDESIRRATLAATVHPEPAGRPAVDEWRGTATEQEEPGGWTVNLAGETDLPTLVSLVEGATVFVGNDGGVAQVASHLQLPSVVIFGPTSPKTWHVASDHSHSVTVDLPCSPCMYHHFELGTPQGCVSRECLDGLSTETVAAAAIELVRSRVGS